MKSVLFILAHMNYTGGVARVLTTLCNNLDLEKYDVTILPLYRSDKELLDTLKPGIKVKKGLGFYFKGLNDILLRIPNKWLYRMFVREKYDIEIAFQTSVPTRIISGSQSEKAVHVFWMHTYHLWGKEYLTGDKVLCVSKCNADKCREEMNGAVDVDYCYNITDDSKIISASSEPIGISISHDSPLFVSVGRLSPEKGYVRLVKIAANLRDKGYKFHIVIVGDGPARESVEQTIDECKANEIITLVGAQTNPHKYTSKADAFICSSYREGYSTACTEAAILGVPIITTNVAGGEEIIEDAECGMLTGMSDTELEAALQQVLDNPSLLVEWKTTMMRTSEKFKLKARRERMLLFFDEFSKLSDQRQG